MSLTNTGSTVQHPTSVFISTIVFESIVAKCIFTPLRTTLVKTRKNMNIPRKALEFRTALKVAELYFSLESTRLPTGESTLTKTHE